MAFGTRITIKDSYFVLSAGLDPRPFPTMKP